MKSLTSCASTHMPAVRCYRRHKSMGAREIFIQHELNSQLQFFRSAGEWFAGARDDGVRYWQIMAVYQDGSRPATDPPGAEDPGMLTTLCNGLSARVQ